MPFKLGNRKPEGSGRRKGTPNKASLEIGQICRAHNFDPGAALVREAMREDIPSSLRLRALFEICSYVYPKRKPIEMNSGAEGKSATEEQVLILTEVARDLRSARRPA